MCSFWLKMCAFFSSKCVLFFPQNVCSFSMKFCFFFFKRWGILFRCASKRIRGLHFLGALLLFWGVANFLQADTHFVLGVAFFVKAATLFFFGEAITLAAVAKSVAKMVRTQKPTPRFDPAPLQIFYMRSVGAAKKCFFFQKCNAGIRPREKN